VADVEAAIFERLQSLSEGKSTPEERQAFDDATKEQFSNFRIGKPIRDLAGEQFPRLLNESLHIVSFGHNRSYASG
jgi:hypothetical protein